MQRAQHCSCLSIPETSSSDTQQLILHDLQFPVFAHQLPQLPTAWKGSVCPAHSCTGQVIPTHSSFKYNVQLWDTHRLQESPSLFL